MKNKQLLCVLLTGALLMAPSVGALAEENQEPTEVESQAEETEKASGVSDEETEVSSLDRYAMEAGMDYELDLDGDGKTETIRYEDISVNDEENGNCQAKADIYRNGELFYSLESQDYTYYWLLSYVTFKDGKTDLLAASVSDNDWTDELLLMSQEDEDSLTVLGNLCELSRREDETSENFLSGWARFGYVLPSEEKDAFTVSWSETLNATGILNVELPYKITEEGIQLSDGPYKIYRLNTENDAMEETQDWTASMELTAKKEPGSDEDAYTIQTGETVTLLEVTRLSGSDWIHCKNAGGEEGWIQDPEQYQYDETNGAYGCFEEAFFAG